MAVGDAQGQMDNAIEIQPSKAAISPSNVQQFNHPNNSDLTNQLKLTTNCNVHIDNQDQLGRVDVSKALCYQSEDLSNNVLTRKILLNVEQHFVDCNNNLNPPMPPPPVYPKILTAHTLSPLNINTQFHPPQFVSHLNWNNPQFQ